MRNNTKCKGVTLLELIISIAVVAILASIAVPAFDNQTKNARISSNASMLAAAFNLARSEAVNRELQVKVSATAGGWEVSEVVSAELIRTFEPNRQGITFSTGVPEVIYNPTGFRTFGSSDEVITLTDDRGVSRIVTISAAGSTKIEK